MKILFLCHRIPYPPDKGDKIRAYNMLAHLAKKHFVHLAAFVDDPADMAHEAALRDMIRGELALVPLSRAARPARMAHAFATGRPLTTSYFASRRMESWISNLFRTHYIDRIFLFSSAMAPFVPGRFDLARVVLDMVDVDSDKWRQYAAATRGPKAWVYRREARTLFALERKAAGAFGATLFVSPYEAGTFADMAPETRARVHSVANGVDLARYSPMDSHPSPFPTGELPVVMVGTMNYRPNAEGAVWFAEQVLPIVRTVLPTARFYAVGAKPTARLRARRDGVVVTGKVDDVRPYLAHAAAVVAPLKLARGVQNKVLEGMAMQKPVVATGPASRGLEVTAGVDLFVKDEPHLFAEAVIAAVTGPDRARIAANGRRRVEQDYDWERNLAEIDRLLEREPRRTARGPSAGRNASAVPLKENAE
jgi:polysaccharide biosynthesis protein PslH